ncbi:MAG TPA: YdeI/OmpD-associated family protein [Bacteroidales bacterium]|nr:YdeI/OmpD-associated family protein [Bacteroidales bacterium]HPS62853.1 YdeI/OmpD-associated family protein [Bacteroidales bacterium]
MEIQGDIVFFASADEFRKWLEGHHAGEKELLVGFYKAGSSQQNMTWSQSVDQALCFGWIDGVRKSIDDERYFIRFTPRKPGSNWSAVNLEKIRKLTAQGLMHPAGIAACNPDAVPVKPWYSYEDDARQLPPEMAATFRENETAWEYFTATPSSYRKMVVHWILSARQETTRLNRLRQLIDASGNQTRLFNQYRNHGY